MCHCHVCMDSKIRTILLLHPPRHQQVYAHTTYLSFPVQSCFLHNSQCIYILFWQHCHVFFCASAWGNYKRCILSLLLSHIIYIWEKPFVCLSLLWLHWFLGHLPELQITCPLSLSFFHFPKTLQIVTFLSSLFLFCEFLWLIPILLQCST